MSLPSPDLLAISWRGGERRWSAWHITAGDGRGGERTRCGIRVVGPGTVAHRVLTPSLWKQVCPKCRELVLRDGGLPPDEPPPEAA